MQYSAIYFINIIPLILRVRILQANFLINLLQHSTMLKHLFSLHGTAITESQTAGELGGGVGRLSLLVRSR